MKKIFFLLLLLPFLASAQKTTPGNYTYIAQKYEWDAGVFKGLNMPAGPGPAAFIAGQVQKAGAVYYDTVGADAGDYIYNGTAWVLQGSPASLVLPDELIQPGYVTYSGTGLKFYISPSIARINGVIYGTDQDSVTLSAADPDDPRKDVIYLATTGVEVLTGTPAGPAAEPQLDADQIKLTVIDVPALATTPGITTQIVYDENTESTVGDFGTTIDPDNTTNVFRLTKSLNVTNMSNGDRVVFDVALPLLVWDLSDVDAISFFIKLKAVLPATAYLRIRFFVGTSTVGGEVTIPVNRANITNYQAVTIPKSSFGNINNQNITRVSIRLTNSAAGDYAGFYLDYMHFVDGLVQPGPSGGVNSVTLQGPAGWTFQGPTTGDVIQNIIPGGASTQMLGGDGVVKTDSAVHAVDPIDSYTKNNDGATINTATKSIGFHLVNSTYNGLMSAYQYRQLDTLMNQTLENASTGDTLVYAIDAFRTAIKSIVAGSNITITPTDTTLVISSTGGGGGSGNIKVQRGGAGIPIWWNNTVDTALVLKDIIGETFISVGTKTDSTNYVRLDTASTGLKDYIANNIAEWALTGNSGLSAATNFVGNTDSVDLVFRTNNESNLILTANRKLLFDSAHVTDPAHSVIFHVPVGASLDGFLIRARNNVSSAKQFNVMDYVGQSVFNVTNNVVNVTPNAANLSVHTIFNTASTRGQVLLNSSATSNTNGLINLSGDIGTTPVVVARNMGNNSNKVLDIRDYLNASNAHILGDGTAKLTNLLLANQTAPGTPASGLGILYPKTSDKKLYWKDDAGVEYDLTGGSSAATGEITKTMYLASPTTADDITYYYSDSAITVTKVADVLTGTSPSVTYNVFFAATRNSGTPDSLFTSPRTTTSITGATTTTFNDNTIPAGSWIWMKTYATGGTVNDISINMLYPGAGGSGGAGGDNIYTADGTLAGNRTVTFNGNSISMIHGGNEFFHIDPDAGAEHAHMQAYNTTGAGNIGGVEANLSNTSAVTTLSSAFNGGAKISTITSSATAADSELQLEADSIKVIGSVSLEPTSTIGHVWTATDAVGNGSFQAAGGGSVDSTGTISRGIIQAATYTLTNTTTLQKLFDVGGTGELTVTANTTYQIECMFSLSAMSATNGNCGFDIIGAGTATLINATWSVVGGRDGVTLATGSTSTGNFSELSAETGNIVTPGVGTNMFAVIKGIIRVNTGGTLIPSVNLTHAAAAVTGVNSYFKVTPIGSGSVTVW